MRLARALALAGVCSRREAEEHIQAGRVVVNDELITAVTTNVDPLQDRIEHDGARVYLQRPRSYVLFKPVDVLCTVKDTHGRQTVIDLLPDVQERVYPVGRLDSDASGVLLLTNDGDLAYRLTHPKYEVKKTYRVWIVGHPDARELRRLARGIVLTRGERPTAPAHVTLLRTIGDASILRLTIHEGRKHEIKRMCERLGYPCSRLVREKFAGVTLYGLEPGESRELKFREVRRLRKLVGLDPGREDILRELDERAGAQSATTEDAAPAPGTAAVTEDAAPVSGTVAPTDTTPPTPEDGTPAAEDAAPVVVSDAPVVEDDAPAPEAAAATETDAPVAEDAPSAPVPEPPAATPAKTESPKPATTRAQPRTPAHAKPRDRPQERSSRSRPPEQARRKRPPQEPRKRHPFGPAPAGKRSPNRPPPEST